MMKPEISRRSALELIGGGVVTALLAGTFADVAKADAKMLAEAIKKAVGDGAMKEGKITLDLPEIAENGNTVPVGFSVESPMTEADYVKTVHLFAEKNPAADVASIHFTPASGVAKAALRIRMAGTQNVVAVAEMSDGTLYTAKKLVKVTIGGCGG
ncbi:MAG: thiosulfate oxidation carrier protein SoxY [Alphaproteobacteria bacterium]|nr:thiosulfate oxidation carrier protein SoxY [Alphaproteobacteria bacterium]